MRACRKVGSGELGREREETGGVNQNGLKENEVDALKWKKKKK